MNTTFVPSGPLDAEPVVPGRRNDSFAVREGPAVGEGFVDDEDAQESIIRRYWRILVRRRWVILGVVLLSMLVGIGLALMTQRMYSATVTLEIAREAETVIDLGGEGQQRRAAADPEFYQTQYALLRSRALASAVARDLRLAANEDFLTGYGAADPAVLPAERQRRETMATNIVMANTEVVPVRFSSVVMVRFASPDPQMAAEVANSLAENFIQFNLERRFDASAYARNFLQNQLAEVRERLEASERQAVAYAGQNEIINIAPTSAASTGEGRQALPEQSLVTASLAAANQALADARTARIEAESRYRQGTRNQPTEILQNSALNSLREQRAALSAQYERQLSDLGPEYPTVRATRAQIAELDRQINQETSRIQSTVANELERQYRQAAAAEAELADRVEQLKSGVLDLRRRSIQYNIFQRDVDTNRALYDALLQRYKEVGIAGGVGTNNVSIVDRAMPPTMPFSPDFRLNLILALIIGLILGAIVAILLEQMDDAVVLPADFQRKLGLPLIGSIPAAGGEEQPLELLSDPKSPVSEAYFSVLTGLRLSTSHGTPASLVVTSTQPGEGKSTTAFALAHGLARLGKNVLLVDGDMRNPSLHKMLDLANRGGLSNILAGEGTIEQHASQSSIGNLSVLTAGPIPPNPAELLAGENLGPVLTAASSRFDHVVIDGPPVLGLADAPLLAGHAEATVFVMEARRTRTAQARSALHRLFSVRTPVVGAVLTKFSAKQAGYGYGYGYEYEYGSSRSSEKSAPA